MPARVAELDIGVGWEPNAPESVLVSGDSGSTVLALTAHFADPDQRAVVLRWGLCVAVIDGPYNDEAWHLHPLYRAGLRDVQWIGEVSDSEWLEAIRPAMAASVAAILRHFVVLTKERTIEVAARDLMVLRYAGSTRDAAFAASTERS
jgi:hypothetical protein